MIEWIPHRPPHASNSSEIRVAERLKSLGESPYTWIVILGYYYQDGQGMRREDDFLILGPAGGLLVLEVKSTLPRHFPETGRWEGADGDDPIQQLHAEWQGVIHGIQTKGNPPFIEKASSPTKTSHPITTTIPGSWPSGRQPRTPVACRCRKRHHLCPYPTTMMASSPDTSFSCIATLSAGRSNGCGQRREWRMVWKV